MLIFDGHSDFLTDITLQRAKGERDIFRTKHIPKLKKGGVNALIGVIWADPPYDVDAPSRMLQIIKSGFADLQPLDQVVFPVKNHREFKKAIEENKIAIILGMEGLSGMEDDPDGLYFLHELGVRHASLTWNEGNAFATGVRAERSEKGVTAKGKKVIRTMEELGMMIDVSHADEKTFWDVMSVVSGPVMASHSNSYSLCPNSRNLKDEQIKAIANSGGLIGINAWPEFVDEVTPTIEKLIDHVDYIVDKAGIDHVSFGFDFTDFLEDDSISSFKTGDIDKTTGLGCAEEIPNLISGLLAKGYRLQDIEKISFRNLENLFARVVK